MKEKMTFLGGIMAAGIISLGLAASASAEELWMYNWTDYIDPALIEKFEKESGIKVLLDNYDSNETVLAKLKSGASGYDVAVVTSDFVPIFIQDELIEPMGSFSWPEYDNLDPRWQSPAWDPENRYTVPWLWGTTSFSVDTAVYSGPTDSLKLLFDPPTELQGRIGMFDAPTEVMALGLAYLGKKQCTTNRDDLRALQALLEGQRPSVKVYSSSGIQDRLISGETSMNQQYSGDALRARLQRPSMRYVYPREGALAWMDNLIVPKGAPNKKAAEAFMRFMLKPENAAMASNYAGYQNAIVGSGKFLKSEFADAPEFNPPKDLKTVFVPTCGKEALGYYDRIWTKIRN